ncbi:MAG: enoyl-CoA hydratase/isomerase family protein [Bacillota bacterium]
MLEKKDHMARVIINRPAQRNAFSREMWTELAEVMRSLERDEGIRVVIITGEGATFAAGADLTQLAVQKEDKERHAYIALVEEALKSIVNFPYPVIAMINGPAIGAGCELALVCDLLICTEETVFAVPAAKLGIVLHYPLIQRLINLVGLSAAREILLLGEPFSAVRAYEMGLVNRVVPPSRLEEETFNLARIIVANAPLSVKGTKKAIAHWFSFQEEEDHSAMEELEGNSFRSEDFLEGLNAFFEKRRPNWRGR